MKIYVIPQISSCNNIAESGSSDDNHTIDLYEFFQSQLKHEYANKLSFSFLLLVSTKSFLVKISSR